jgi:peptidoglycan hydrolase-like protein with peptidoglycan-binding domain
MAKPIRVFSVCVLAPALSWGTAVAAPKDYDGVWNATLSCGPSIYNELPFSYERRVTVVDGTFAFSRERLLWNNRFNTTIRHNEDFSGRIENGVLTINGKGSTSQPDIPAWRYDFSGPAASNQSFDLKGGLIQDGAGFRNAAQNRSCSLTMKLAEPAPMSLAGLETNKAAMPATATLDADTIRQVQTVLQSLGLYGGTLDGLWGRGTEAAVKEWQRRNGVAGTFDAAQASMLVRSQQPASSQPVAGGDLSEKERQLAQRERDLAEREKRLEAQKTTKQAEDQAARQRAEAERARQLADRQKQLDAKERQIASQEKAQGVSNTASSAPTGSSPFVGSWCSLSPGGSLSKLDIHRVDGQAATGHYKYNGLPTQLDEPITGVIGDGVFRARIGNISWTLTRKGSALEGTAANNRTGVTHFMQMKSC